MYDVQRAIYLHISREYSPTVIVKANLFMFKCLNLWHKWRKTLLITKINEKGLSKQIKLENIFFLWCTIKIDAKDKKCYLPWMHGVPILSSGLKWLLHNLKSVYFSIESIRAYIIFIIFLPCGLKYTSHSLLFHVSSLLSHYTFEGSWESSWDPPVPIVFIVVKKWYFLCLFMT